MVDEAHLHTLRGEMGKRAAESSRLVAHEQERFYSQVVLSRPVAASHRCSSAFMVRVQ